jgi:hypothetical protein
MSKDMTIVQAFRKGNQDAYLYICLDKRPFNMNRLRHDYSPTGLEDTNPVKKRFGNFNFYYYGPGGGGVDYPDQYFLNLNGSIVIFLFAGPYVNDKTPPEATKRMEARMLASFVPIRTLRR